MLALPLVCLSMLGCHGRVIKIHNGVILNKAASGCLARGRRVLRRWIRFVYDECCCRHCKKEDLAIERDGGVPSTGGTSPVTPAKMN